MNYLEFFLITLVLLICQQVVELKEGLLTSFIEKEREKLGKLFKPNQEGGGRQGKHLDINRIGDWLNKVITDVANPNKPANNDGNARNPNPIFDSNNNRPYPTDPSPNYPPFRQPMEDGRPPHRPPPHNRPYGEGSRDDWNDEFNRPNRPPPNSPHPYPQPYPRPDNINEAPSENGERCLTPNQESGFCRLVEDCPIRPVITDYANFLKYSCTIGKHGVGVCCPASYNVQDRPRPSTSRPVTSRPNPRPNTQTPRPTTVRPTSRPATNAPTGRRSLIDESKEDCGYQPKTRIVGGTDAKKDAWPWAVPIFNSQSYKDQFCGGALITRRHVLTAAHCMVHRKPKDIFIRVGAYNIHEEDENENAYNVIKIVSHPQYNNVSNANDISLLTLEKDVPFDSNKNPACVPNDNDDYVKQNATVVGWGTTSYSGTSSNTLKEVTIPVWPLKDCQNVYGKEKITDKQICAGLKQGGKDSCQGDSGGPLLRLSTTRRRFEVIGVVSYGFRCAEANNPGVYTRTNKYYSWIEKETTM